MDGQILVLYDVLGITQGRLPRFVENFMAGADSPLDARACGAYVQAVKNGDYPAPRHCFSCYARDTFVSFTAQALCENHSRHKDVT